MAYTDDAVLAKLSALNETQESIVSYLQAFGTNLDPNLSQVTVAQWVMFHRYANIIVFARDAIC